MPTSAPRYVFVYGTLRQGEQRDINGLRPAPEWVATGLIAGTLYDLGDYPGLVLSPHGGDAGRGLVHGEIYSISPELERALDEIEEVWPQQTGEYAKREVLVKTAVDTADMTGLLPATLNCLTYEIAPERTIGKPVIANGDWVQRHRQ